MWVLSKNKTPKRCGKVQLIDATGKWEPMRRSLGNKRKFISEAQIAEIVKLYTEFEESELCHILPNEEFLYKEYTVKQPLQRSYQITEERIEKMASSKFSDNVHNPAKLEELELSDEEDLNSKDLSKLKKLRSSEPVFQQMIRLLKDNLTDTPTQDYKGFAKSVKAMLSELPPFFEGETTAQRKSVVDKVVDAMSVMDKSAPLRYKRDGSIEYDDATKDTELVKLSEDVDDYFEREVWPYVPDAKWFDEESDSVVKTGAEIPFTRFFYKYEVPESSDALLAEFNELESQLQDQIKELMM